GSLLSICLAGFLSYRSSQAELTNFRAEVARQVGMTTGPSLHAEIEEVEGWLLRAGKDWNGTRNSQDLIEPAALSALRSRTTVYVRAPIAQLKTSAGITQAAFESIKDSFLLCLMTPPESDSEE